MAQAARAANENTYQPKVTDMRAGDLLIALTAAIRDRAPILIEGSPGVGKSDLLAQACIAAGADLIYSHPAVSDPTDIKGLPGIVNGQAAFLPFGELRQALAATRLTCWAWEDLGQALPATQASAMQLFLARRVNDHILPDVVTFIATTNRRTDKAGVSGILEPVKSRMVSIVGLIPHIEDWGPWMIDHGGPPELIAFLRFCPDLLCAFQPTADMSNSPVPRTWAHVARILRMGLPGHILAAMVAGAVGEGAATQFLAFLKTFRSLPSVDSIIKDPKSVAIPDDLGVLYALAGALAYSATELNFKQVLAFADRLLDSGHGEFAVLLAKDALRRDPKLAATPAFVDRSTSELGLLVSGQGV